MNEPPMTEKTSISMGLVMWLVGATMAGAGAWTWQQSEVAQIRADVDAGKRIADSQAQERIEQAARIERRMRNIEIIMCTTDDAARARLCDNMGVLK